MTEIAAKSVATGTWEVAVAAAAPPGYAVTYAPDGGGRWTWTPPGGPVQVASDGGLLAKGALHEAWQHYVAGAVARAGSGEAFEVGVEPPGYSISWSGPGPRSWVVRKPDGSTFHVPEGTSHLFVVRLAWEHYAEARSAATMAAAAIGQGQGQGQGWSGRVEVGDVVPFAAVPSNAIARLADGSVIMRVGNHGKYLSTVGEEEWDKFEPLWMWEDEGEGDVTVLALGVPTDASATELKRLASGVGVGAAVQGAAAVAVAPREVAAAAAGVAVGSRVKWADVPSGAVVRCARGEFAMRVGGQGKYVRGLYPNGRWSAFDPAWSWSTEPEQDPEVVIAALGVPETATADEIKRIVEACGGGGGGGGGGTPIEEGAAGPDGGGGAVAVAPRVGQTIELGDLPDGAVAKDHVRDVVVRRGDRYEWVSVGGWGEWKKGQRELTWPPATFGQRAYKVVVLALDVPRDATVEDYRAIAGKSLVGDVVDLRYLPPGAMAAATRQMVSGGDPGHVMRVGDCGWWVHSADECDRSTKAPPWPWADESKSQLYGHDRNRNRVPLRGKIVALGLTGSETADELRRFAAAAADGGEDATVKVGGVVAWDKVPPRALVQDSEGAVLLRVDAQYGVALCDQRNGVGWRSEERAAGFPFEWSGDNDDGIRRVRGKGAKVLALDVPAVLSLADARRLAGESLVVGDKIDWEDVPSGAIMKSTYAPGSFVMRLGDGGCYVKDGDKWRWPVEWSRQWTWPPVLERRATEIAALDVATELTLEQLKTLLGVKDVQSGPRVGDEIELRDTPNGAMVRHVDRHGKTGFVVHYGSRGLWVWYEGSADWVAYSDDWSAIRDGRGVVVALDVPQGATVDELKRLATSPAAAAAVVAAKAAVCGPGDVVPVADVPDGAICKYGVRQDHYAVKLDGRGWDVGGVAPEAEWLAYGSTSSDPVPNPSGWLWSSANTGKTDATIVAVGVTGKESGAELRKLAGVVRLGDKYNSDDKLPNDVALRHHSGDIMLVVDGKTTWCMVSGGPRRKAWQTVRPTSANTWHDVGNRFGFAASSILEVVATGVSVVARSGDDAGVRRALGWPFIGAFVSAKTGDVPEDAVLGNVESGDILVKIKDKAGYAIISREWTGLQTATWHPWTSGTFADATWVLLATGAKHTRVDLTKLAEAHWAA